MFGGRGEILWIAYGVVLFVLQPNALNLLNLTYVTVLIVKGGLILAAAWLDVRAAPRRGCRDGGPGRKRPR